MTTYPEASDALAGPTLAAPAVTPPPAADPEERTPSARWSRYLEAELGLRDYWYPVCFGEELAEGETLAEMVCGEPVIFKRVDGRVYGVEDRCAHRGVAFSARPECHTKHTLTCWFHGFTYDVRDGKLVQILSQPGSPLLGKVSLRQYPVVEAFETVFVWIGDGTPAPFAEEVPPQLAASLAGEARVAFHPIARVVIPCNWRLATENGFDPGHVYGHRNSDLARRGIYAAPLGVFPSTNASVTFRTEPGQPKAMVLEYEQWSTVWEAEIEGVEVSARPPVVEGQAARQFPECIDADDAGGAGVAYLPCLYAAPSFPAERMTHYEWYVPVDADHHLYLILHTKLVYSDEEEAEFHEECERLWSPLIWSTDDEVEGFNNFDAFGREEVQHAYAREGFWDRERLYRPDYPLVQWRLFVSREARAVQSSTRYVSKGPKEPSVTRFVKRTAEGTPAAGDG